MAGATTREFDVAAHLGSPEEIAAYLDAVLEEGMTSSCWLRSVMLSNRGGSPRPSKGLGCAARLCTGPFRKTAIPGCPY